MKIILHKGHFGVIYWLKNKSFSFVLAMFFLILTGWVINAITYNNTAVSAPKATACSVSVVATEMTLRHIPEQALSPDVVHGMLREKGLFDTRRNPAGHGVSHTYEIQKDGKVVYDQAGGLMWQQAGSQDEMNYRDAKGFIAALNENRFAGFHDWRLPTLEEAISLVEPTRQNGGLYIDLIFDSCQKQVWTSDFRKDGMAWIVWFDSGFCDYAYTDNNIRYHVRAVRKKH